MDGISRSGRKWREVRSRATRFAVAPGHTAIDLEWVVTKDPRFWIIEKQDEAAKVAAKQE